MPSFSNVSAGGGDGKNDELQQSSPTVELWRLRASQLNDQLNQEREYARRLETELNRHREEMSNKVEEMMRDASLQAIEIASLKRELSSFDRHIVPAENTGGGGVDDNGMDTTEGHPSRCAALSALCEAGLRVVTSSSTSSSPALSFTSPPSLSLTASSSEVATASSIVSSTNSVTSNGIGGTMSTVDACPSSSVIGTGLGSSRRVGGSIDADLQSHTQHQVAAGLVGSPETMPRGNVTTSCEEIMVYPDPKLRHPHPLLLSNGLSGERLPGQNLPSLQLQHCAPSPCAPLRFPTLKFTVVKHEDATKKGKKKAQKAKTKVSSKKPVLSSNKRKLNSLFPGEDLPRGITMRPSGKWVSENVLQF